jgi:hypothetical protein
VEKLRWAVVVLAAQVSNRIGVLVHGQKAWIEIRDHPRNPRQKGFIWTGSVPFSPQKRVANRGFGAIISF